MKKVLATSTEFCKNIEEKSLHVGVVPKWEQWVRKVLVEGRNGLPGGENWCHPLLI